MRPLLIVFFLSCFLLGGGGAKTGGGDFFGGFEGRNRVEAGEEEEKGTLEEQQPAYAINPLLFLLLFWRCDLHFLPQVGGVEAEVRVETGKSCWVE